MYRRAACHANTSIANVSPSNRAPAQIRKDQRCHPSVDRTRPYPIHAFSPLSGRRATNETPTHKGNEHETNNYRQSILIRMMAVTAAYTMSQDERPWTGRLVSVGDEALTMLSDQTVLSTAAFPALPTQ